MRKTVFGIAVLLALCNALVAFGVTVSDVSARQRWPWNGLIDVDFTIGDAAAGDVFRVEVTAAYADGTKRVTGRTYLGEPLFGRGANRVTWDFGADCPDLKATDLQVAVNVAPVNADAADVYMVIDLSSGPSSTRYPVRYTFTAPELVPTNDLVACAADPNRTTKLWLKRIKANTFNFYGTTSAPAGIFTVHLSPFYIGVFELTQMQYALVMDAWPSEMTNVTYRAARPVTNVNYEDVIGHNNWPDNRVMGENSYIAKMRARTGLATFSLPTEAQWESACRVGDNTTVQINNTVGRFKFPAATTCNEGPDEAGTAIVGSYRVNGWGLYDMLGNVWEMCLDAFASNETLVALYEGQDPVEDPVGPGVNSTARYHATRGGGWYNSEAGYCNCYRRDWGNKSSTTGYRHNGVGFRVAVSPEWK